MLAPYRALVAWVVSAALLAAIEWALLLADGWDYFSGTAQRLAMLPLQYGNFLTHALGTLCAFALIGVGIRRAERRLSPPRARLLVASIIALTLLPYSIWLARFTFSGPQARVLPLHTLWVGLTTLVISLAFAAAAWFHGWRAERRRLAVPMLAALAVGAAVSIWTSGAVLANEYEPLHAFLGYWSLILAVLFGHEVAALAGPGPLRFAVLAASGAGAWAIGSGLILARADQYAWIVWSHTATSRYVTERWPALPRTAGASLDTSRMLLKPDLENGQTRAWRERRARAPAPNIVIFSIDGLRFDHVGAYGYTRRPSTPNIDRFARRGVRFTRAYSNFPMTQNFNSALLLGRFVPPFSAHRPPAPFQELAITRLLDRRDYHIFVKAWFEHSSRNAFDPGVYKIDTNIPKEPGRQTVSMTERLKDVERHLKEARAKSAPALLWLHLLETHIQGRAFIPHPEFKFGNNPEDLYDSAVAGADRWLGEIEKLLTALGDPSRETVWMIFSDHGTKLDSMGRNLYEYIVRVPLVIVAPGVTPKVIDDPVDTALDLAATIVDFAGIEPPPSYDGVSLIPVLNMGSQSALESRIIPLSRRAGRGAVYQNYKLLVHKGVPSLFDTVRDPGETRNLMGEQGALANQMSRVTENELRRRANHYRRGSREVEEDPADDE